MRIPISRGLVTAMALVMSLASASALQAQATVTKPATAKPAMAKPAMAKPATVKPAMAVPAVELVDINHATAEQLKAVPGIGDAYAAKIIAGRPYANKTQLQSKKVLPAAVYKKVQAKIVAKQ